MVAKTKRFAMREEYVRGMNTNDLRAFHAVVEVGTLSGAAALLEVPKSTIGRRLSRLEEELDLQLVIRTSRKITVTNVGMRLHRLSLPVVAELDEVKRTLLDEAEEPTGTLRVAVPEDVATVWMGDVCGRVIRKYPQLQIQLVSSKDTVNLLAEGFDVALRIHLGPLADVTSIKVRSLCSVDVGLYATPDYVQEHKRLRRPSDLASHSCLSMASLGATWTLQRGKDEQVVKPNRALTSNDHHALRDAACAGAGVAVLPSFLCGRHLEEQQLVRVLKAWSLRKATLSLLWPNTRYVSPRLRVFLDESIEFFSAIA